MLNSYMIFSIFWLMPSLFFSYMKLNEVYTYLAQLNDQTMLYGSFCTNTAIELYDIKEMLAK